MLRVRQGQGSGAPWRLEIAVGSQQAGLEALGAALQGFSKAKSEGRRVGFPKFKRRGECTESILFQRPRVADSRSVDFDKRLGPVRTKESMRKLARLLERDPQAHITRSRVRRTSSGRWYVSFTVRRSPKRHRRPRRPNAVAGLDVGLRRAATLSTGHIFENLRPLGRALRRLRRLERQADRRRRASNPNNYNADGTIKPGPKSWVKSKSLMATERRIKRLHERLANLRRERAHLITTALVREFGVIAVETLAVRNMLKDRRLARHIADVGWGLILEQLSYKTTWAGSLHFRADRFYPSSKTCSSCSAVKAKLGCAEPIFRCDDCGLAIDRDLNAALNLAELGLAFAQSEGREEAYVARTARVTQTAASGRQRAPRGGLVSPGRRARQRSVKREGWPARASHPAA